MADDPGFQQVERCFRTHAPRPQVQELMDLLLVRAHGLATLVVEAVPPCRERAMALTEIEAAVTHARAGLAREDAVNNGVSVQRHREQMPRTSAARPASIVVTQPAAAALQGLHALLARVIRDFAAGDLDRLYLGHDERALLDGFLAMHPVAS